LKIFSKQAEQKARTLSRSADEKQQHAHALAEAVATLDVTLKEKAEALSNKENEIFQIRELLQQKTSRKESLEELQSQLEGYSPSVREILTKLGEEAAETVLLGEVLTPVPELEEHLEVLLGDVLNTVLVPTGQSPKPFKFGFTRRIGTSNRTGVG